MVLWLNSHQNQFQCFVLHFQGLLGTWVEVETASAMLQHLLAGCPQQLYAPREFCSLYWCAAVVSFMLKLHGDAVGRQSAPLICTFEGTSLVGSRSANEQSLSLSRTGLCNVIA